jgi:hypothetical protein
VDIYYNKKYFNKNNFSKEYILQFAETVKDLNVKRNNQIKMRNINIIIN